MKILTIKDTILSLILCPYWFKIDSSLSLVNSYLPNRWDESPDLKQADCLARLIVSKKATTIINDIKVISSVVLSVFIFISVVVLFYITILDHKAVFSNNIC